MTVQGRGGVYLSPQERLELQRDIAKRQAREGLNADPEEQAKFGIPDFMKDFGEPQYAKLSTGVEGYAPLTGTLAQIPQDRIDLIEAQIGGQMDNTLKNLTLAHFQTFGTWPDFDLTADILENGEVEFETLEEAMAFFGSVKEGYSGTGRSWQLESSGASGIPGQEVPGWATARVGAEGKWSPQTDVLDPEMIASFRPKSVDDFLFGPYMKRSIKGKSNMFRDGAIRLDDMLIQVPRQWAISQLAEGLGRTGRQYNPDLNQDEALMKQLNQFLIERIPDKSIRPAPTAQWQDNTEKSLRFLQMMRAASIYMASEEGGEARGEQATAAAGFLQQQGFGDMLGTLDQQIRTMAVPSGSTPDEQRKALDQNAAAIEQMWIASRNPGITPRMALNQLHDLNPNATTLATQKQVGNDSMMSHFGMAFGWLGHVPGHEELVKLWETDEFKAVRSVIPAVVGEIGDVLDKIPVQPGRAVGVGPEMSLKESMVGGLEMMTKYYEYRNLVLVTTRQMNEKQRENPASEVVSKLIWGIPGLVVEAFRGDQNDVEEANTIARRQTFAQYLTIHNKAHPGDPESMGSFVDRWKFYWHNNQDAKGAGISMQYTDELMRDVGVNPIENPEFSFLAGFAADTVLDLAMFRGAGAGLQMARATKTFRTASEFAASDLHIATVSKVVENSWEKSKLWDDISDANLTKRIDLSRPTRGTGRTINREEFTTRLQSLFGLYKDDISALSYALENGIKLDGTPGTVKQIIDDAIPQFVNNGKKVIYPDQWAIFERAKEKMLYEVTSPLYRLKHPYLTAFLERTYATQKFSVAEGQSESSSQRLASNMRTTIGKTKGGFEKAVDDYWNLAIRENDVRSSKILLDIKKNGDINRLADFIAGRYMRAGEDIKEIARNEWDVGHQMRLNGAETEAVRATIAAEKYVPDVKKLEGRIAGYRKSIATSIDQINSDLDIYTPASKSYQKYMAKEKNRSAARIWFQHLDEMGYKNRDGSPIRLIPRKAERMAWEEKQRLPEDRITKGVVSQEDIVKESIRDIADQKAGRSISAVMVPSQAITKSGAKEKRELSKAWHYDELEEMRAEEQRQLDRYNKLREDSGLLTTTEVEAADARLEALLIERDVMKKIAREAHETTAKYDRRIADITHNFIESRDIEAAKKDAEKWVKSRKFEDKDLEKAQIELFTKTYVENVKMQHARLRAIRNEAFDAVEEAKRMLPFDGPAEFGGMQRGVHEQFARGMPRAGRRSAEARRVRDLQLERQMERSRLEAILSSRQAPEFRATRTQMMEWISKAEAEVDDMTRTIGERLEPFMNLEPEGIMDTSRVAPELQDTLATLMETVPGEEIEVKNAADFIVKINSFGGTPEDVARQALADFDKIFGSTALTREAQESLRLTLIDDLRNLEKARDHERTIKLIGRRELYYQQQNPGRELYPQIRIIPEKAGKVEGQLVGEYTGPRWYRDGALVGDDRLELPDAVRQRIYKKKQRNEPVKGVSYGRQDAIDEMTEYLEGVLLNRVTTVEHTSRKVSWSLVHDTADIPADWPAEAIEEWKSLDLLAQQIHGYPEGMNLTKNKRYTGWNAQVDANVKRSLDDIAKKRRALEAKYSEWPMRETNGRTPVGSTEPLWTAEQRSGQLTEDWLIKGQTTTKESELDLGKPAADRPTYHRDPADQRVYDALTEIMDEIWDRHAAGGASEFHVFGRTSQKDVATWVGEPANALHRRLPIVTGPTKGRYAEKLSDSGKRIVIDTKTNKAVAAKPVVISTTHTTGAAPHPFVSPFRVRAITVNGRTTGYQVLDLKARKVASSGWLAKSIRDVSDADLKDYVASLRKNRTKKKKLDAQRTLEFEQYDSVTIETQQAFADAVREEAAMLEAKPRYDAAVRRRKLVVHLGTLESNIVKAQDDVLEWQRSLAKGKAIVGTLEQRKRKLARLKEERAGVKKELVETEHFGAESTLTNLTKKNALALAERKYLEYLGTLKKKTVKNFMESSQKRGALIIEGDSKGTLHKFLTEFENDTLKSWNRSEGSEFGYIPDVPGEIKGEMKNAMKEKPPKPLEYKKVPAQNEQVIQGLWGETIANFIKTNINMRAPINLRTAESEQLFAQRVARRAAERAATREVIPDVPITKSGVKMYYEMPAGDNVTGEATTTLKLIQEGKRISSTRGPALGKVGDVITFEGDKMPYRITDVHKITAADRADSAWLAELSRTEGWTEEAILKMREFRVGQITTRFERVTTETRSTEAWRPKRIISGAQAGGDNGGLRAAAELGIPHEAHAFPGFKPKTGEVPGSAKRVDHPLKGDYVSKLRQRTELNVKQSDATIILVDRAIESTSGSKLTLSYAKKHNKPVLVIQAGDKDSVKKVQDFLAANRPETLNIAGTRTANEAGVQELLVRAMKQETRPGGVGKPPTSPRRMGEFGPPERQPATPGGMQDRPIATPQDLEDFRKGTITPERLDEIIGSGNDEQANAARVELATVKAELEDLNFKAATEANRERFLNAELKIKERELENAKTMLNDGKGHVRVIDKEALATLREQFAIISEGQLGAGLSSGASDAQVIKDLGETIDNAAKMLDSIEGDPEGFMSVFHPGKGINLETEAAMEWQMNQWYFSRYNYSKLSKFIAGGPIKAMEQFNSKKRLLFFNRWSLDDATTLYKTIVMAKVSTMLRIPLADEATRFISEGINPLVAWKKARMLKDFDKMPQDIQFKLSELIRKVSDGPYSYIDYDAKGAFTHYQHFVTASRRDATYSRFLLGKRLQEKGPSGVNEMDAEIRMFLEGQHPGEENLQAIVRNYKKQATEKRAKGIPEAVADADELDFKAWYALGYRRDGALRGVGAGTHRFIDESDVTLQSKPDQLYVNTTEGSVGGPAAKATGVPGVRGDASGLVDALYKQFDYYYSHPILGKHWRPERWKQISAQGVDEWETALRAGKVPDDMLFGHLIDGLFDHKEAKRAWQSIGKMKVGDDVTLVDGTVVRATEAQINSWRPVLTGQRTFDGSNASLVHKMRDGLYGILDYSGAKMNEMVYANAFTENVEMLKKAAGRKLTEDEIIDIEKRAHFTARAYTERVMFNNITYGGEEFLRNLVMFLPAYRQFATYWAPYLAKHPFALSLVYRANRDKENFKVRSGPFEFNLGRMSFLINQADTVKNPTSIVTGWLPNGAPLLTVPVSTMAHFSRKDEDNVWGNLAGKWPFEFAGEFTALNSPLDKIFYGATSVLRGGEGISLPWPFGTDNEKNLWRAVQIQNEALRNHNKRIGREEAMWRVGVNRLIEGGYNFFSPVGARITDTDIESMTQGRVDYNKAKTPEEVAAILAKPEMSTFKTFLKWQNLPSYEQLDFIAKHPEIVPFAVSGYSAGSNSSGSVGILYDRIKDNGVPDPELYVSRVDAMYKRIDLVLQAAETRKLRDEEESWWYAYKSAHSGLHQIERLQNEWDNSTGEFAPGGTFYIQGHHGIKEYRDLLNEKYVGIDDPYTGLTYTPGQPEGDGYRLAKFMDQMGGPTQKLLKMSPNYEMYVRAKYLEKQENVTGLLKEYMEGRVTTRLTKEQIRQAGYSDEEVVELDLVIKDIDKMWNAADAYADSAGGYTSSRGRQIRKQAIDAQNAVIHSSPLTEKFLGDNVTALYQGTYLTTPSWKRTDYVRLDKMDKEEREMFNHLTTELDPETGVPRLEMSYLPEREKQLLQSATVLGYVPILTGNRLTWRTKVSIGGIVGTIAGKTPKEAGLVKMSWQKTRSFLKDSFDDMAKTEESVKQWRKGLKEASIPTWVSDLVEEDLRAQSWSSWLAAAGEARRNLRDTVNVEYGGASGYSPASKLGLEWKAYLIEYGDSLALLSPAFAEEWEKYNGDNVMTNSILDWYL